MGVIMLRSQRLDGDINLIHYVSTHEAAHSLTMVSDQLTQI